MECRDCGAKKSTSWRRGRCSACHSAYRAQSRAGLNERLRLFVFSMKRVGCVQCDEADPACLDYHHIDPTQKEFAMGKRVTSRGVPSLFQESAKCAVVCANCHRKHHYYPDTTEWALPGPKQIRRRLQHAVEAAAITEQERAMLWASWLEGAQTRPSASP